MGSSDGGGTAHRVDARGLAGRRTIADVARAARVSVSTVSRALNDQPGVAPVTRARVLQAAEELGYVVNLAARSLVRGETETVGLVVHDVVTDYMSAIIQGVDDALLESGYNLVIYTTHRDQNKERASVSLLSKGMVDGLLLVLPYGAEHYLPELVSRGFPCVLIDHRGLDSQVPSVVATNWRGAHEATRYLTELGHRRIGFITGVPGWGCTVDRLQGYRDALEEAGIAYDPTLVVEGDFRREGGYRAASELLSLTPRPTAIFASNDLSAFGAMGALSEAGLRIPQDMSLVGFDDIPMSAQVYPPLTTVRQPLYEMGHRSAGMLLAMLRGEALQEQRVLLPTELIIRESCSACPGQQAGEPSLT